MILLKYKTLMCRRLEQISYMISDPLNTNLVSKSSDWLNFCQNWAEMLKSSGISYSKVCNPNIANPKFTPSLCDLGFGLQHAFLYSQRPWLFFGIQRITFADFFYVFFLEQPLISDTSKNRPWYLRPISHGIVFPFLLYLDEIVHFVLFGNSIDWFESSLNMNEENVQVADRKEWEPGSKNILHEPLVKSTKVLLLSLHITLG